MTRTIDAASLEAAIVRNCSPTLAGIKPASLFTFPGSFAGDDPGVPGRRSAFLNALAACRTQLAPAGIHLRVLVWRGCGALVYAYRPGQLARYLRDPRAAWPLAAEGYPVRDIDACLDRLAERLAARGKQTERFVAEDPGAAEDRDARPCPCGAKACDAAFPHEIGFFLGYPYADVSGFIEHGGRDFILMGAWKVYGDVEGALAAFARLRACTAACTQRYRRGDGLGELAVACA